MILRFISVRKVLLHIILIWSNHMSLSQSIF